jgi:hypothetical protein
MSSPFEKFIRENREKFDADVPDPRIWEKISERMNPESVKVNHFRSLPFKRWLAAAAAVVLILVSGVLYYSMRTDKTAETMARTKPKQVVHDNLLPKATPPADSVAAIAQTKPDDRQKSLDSVYGSSSAFAGKIPETEDNKEMYYYAKLIELKHEELRTLEKDEPLLYRQFAGDVQKLDSVYHSLKTQLPNNSNREQVLEAMISNLQLQIGLLNRQLEIIKQIKHSKKTAYEKAYKSV